ncbi:MAG TPA: sulfatase-like hydrolase/transferase [Lacunisphaera sp.]|nr:sulfatase-like hydrolase/transferase [Lacunisphaera sp.]
MIVARGDLRAADGPRPNIVLLITDQQYGRALGAFLPARELQTPNLDRLTATGANFTRAYAANPRCVPSRSSLFTGHYPHETRVQENDGAEARGFTQPLLGRYFSDAGYATAYFGKFHLPVEDATQRGFQQMAHLGSIGQDAAATADAVRFLREPHARPFFLTVSFCNPHNICEYARREALPDGEVPAPPNLAACPPAPGNPDLPVGECDTMIEQKALRAAIADYRYLEAYSADDWRRYRWAYYRMIEKVDAQVGLILAALRDADPGGNTLVVFTSDHGECGGAHGFGEKVVFYEESVRVPFVLTWPEHIQPGQRTALVNTGIDLLPTLCDFAGIPRPAGLSGHSVRTLAPGAAPADWRNFVVAENLQEAGAARVHGRMVRTDRFKYCVYDRGQRRESLFDEIADSLEKTNLAYDPTYRAQVELSRSYLREHAGLYGDATALALLANLP